MSTELSGIPFDHYQRYAAAASLVSALQLPSANVLEVGANRQRLLADFLPNCHFIFSDLFEQAGKDDFVQADASALPFADRQFDVSIALDVFEHMPVQLRARAAAEMARVAGRMVIIACPPDKPWVHAAEDDANAVWKNYFGESYPWLDEHKEFGLVAGDDIDQALVESHYKVFRFGQGDTSIWSGLMTAHFVKEAISEMRPLVEAADRLYNSNVCPGDRSPHCYREYFVAVRHEADFLSVQKSAVLNAPADAGAAAFVSSLGKLLIPIADRTLSAEREWKSLAESLRISEEKQRQIAEEWGRTAGLLRDSERNCVEIAAERDRISESLRQSEEKQAEVATEWGRTAELYRACESRLTTATSEQLELRRKYDALHEKSNADLREIDRVVSANNQLQARLDGMHREIDRRTVELTNVNEEKNRVEGLLSALESVHASAVSDIQTLATRVRLLERRQRWLGLALGAVVLMALAAHFFHII